VLEREQTVDLVRREPLTAVLTEGTVRRIVQRRRWVAQPVLIVLAANEVLRVQIDRGGQPWLATDDGVCARTDAKAALSAAVCKRRTRRVAVGGSLL
jgi:hypothetical protein